MFALPEWLCSDAINNAEVPHQPLASLPHSRLIQDLPDPRLIQPYQRLVTRGPSLDFQGVRNFNVPDQGPSRSEDPRSHLYDNLLGGTTHTIYSPGVGHEEPTPHNYTEKFHSRHDFANTNAGPMSSGSSNEMSDNEWIGDA